MSPRAGRRWREEMAYATWILHVSLEKSIMKDGGDTVPWGATEAAT